MWLKGINSVVSKFGFEGVRPSRQERQILDGLAPGHQTHLVREWLLKQQYGYNLEDLEQLELEAPTSPAMQWQSLLKEMGYTHEQISSARQALGPSWGVPASQVDDYDAITEWLVNDTAEPKATLGFVSRDPL